jgi:hypothetical protein
MAIDKNFVIKNGLEVNTNVLVAAADEKQVGIGTTRPYYKLHVGGGEGSRGGIGATDLTISGIATIGVAHSDSGAFRVLGISTFQGDVDLLGSAGVSTVRWDASKDGLIFQDNATARFGTGEDLRIWHDGSNSYISDQGTGSLIIYGTDETLAVFTDDGSVQLYNNDSKKLETTGLGITVYGDSIVSGVTTTARLNVTGIATVGTALSLADNIKAQFGTDGDLIIYANSTDSEIKDTSGRLSLVSNQVYLELESGTNILKGDQFGVIVTGVTTTNRLYVSGISTFADTVNVSTGATITTAGNAAFAGIVTANGGVNVGTAVTIDAETGNIAAAGIVTANGGINVGTAVTIDAETGNVAISGITTIGGNLYVTGDITYDEVTGRNLNITGFTTFSGDVLFDGTNDITWDASESAVVFNDGAAIRVGTGSDFSIMHDGSNTIMRDTGTGGLYLMGSAITITGAAGGSETLANFIDGGKASLHFDNVEKLSTVSIGATVFGDFIASGVGTFANLKVAGIATADRFIGIHTSADGGGIGIGSTTAHVGYGITYIDFKGPGVSTVYSSSVTGITTIYFQGGGSSVGAAGTWQNDGSQGISTAKSVGINTVGVAVTALMGGVKGASSGIGASMQGLYIGNGMMINDNQLNGNHYIGTAFGGIMAGPVTVNGVVTVDGNWAVV